MLRWLRWLRWVAALCLVVLVGCGEDSPRETRPVELSPTAVSADDGKGNLRVTEVSYKGSTFICIRYVGNGGLWCERLAP